MKKPTIPFERHKEIAEFLRSTRNALMDLQAEVAKSRGSRRQKGAARALFRAFEKINEARSELEEVMFVDHPERAHVRVYYGEPGPRA